jgi:electron transfer flavoprotein alpha subunit
VEKLLVLIHTEADGSAGRSALEAVQAARVLGEFEVGVAGNVVAPAADQLAACGASRFLAVEGAAFSASRYATDAAAAAALCRASGATLVLAAGTSRWMRCLPGVAQRLNGRIDTHVVGVEPGPRVTRWYYRQRIEATLDRPERPWIVVLESGVAAPYDGPAGTATVEKVAVEVDSRTRVIGIESPRTGEQTIRPEADLLFVAGAGWTKKQKDGQVHVDEAASLILGMVQKAKASLGSSKSLVDLSGEGQAVLPFLSHLNQVGQTGSTPRHAKGLATCCHGEEPHVVGWRFIKERRAVNLDANCGWARGKADVLYVADAFDVVRELNRMLDK